ncbi:hypothetical protein CHUAL_006010 [Chamberlinius hualienensis]
MSSSDSSSSDESAAENLQKFRSAVDPKFEYNSNAALKAGGNVVNKVEGLSSRRHHQEEQRDYKFNELKTTPEFRKHVAKKLTNIIDSQITFVDKQSTSPKTSSSVDTGIYLLSTSKQFAVIDEDEQIKVQKRPKTKILKKKNKKIKLNENSSSSSTSSSTDEEEEVNRYSSAAVSVDWILKHSSPLQ